ncbi:MAG: class I SAM-dependent methyltransferase [Solirubrobacteraceae bacterium]
MHSDTSDLAVLERLAAPAGKDVLDVGCGAGHLTRALTQAGARVVGLDVSADQLAPALAANAEAGAETRVKYVVGTAQALPLADAAFDLVVFMRSLHHIPVAEQTAALREARRVLAPGGLVYAAEPLPKGDFFELTSLVEDELEVRRAAQRALAAAAEVGLEPLETVEYEVTGHYPHVEAFRARIVAAEPEREPIFEARAGEIHAAFGHMGEPAQDGEGRVFRQPMLAQLLRAV